jgi:long-chain acyl-CoA synthetase
MIEAAPTGARCPFDTSGIERDADGIARYTNRPASVVALLRASVDRNPRGTAIVDRDGGPTLSYEELWDRASRVAGGLRTGGVGRGDRVAVRLLNSADWVLAYFGTLMAGGVVVPVNTRLADTEVAYVLEDSGAAVAFAPGDTLPEGDPLVEENLGPEDLAAILYTSGTTGFPKGATATHGNFLANSESLIRAVELRDSGTEVRTLISVPLFHVTGCNSQLIPVLELGGTVDILRKALDLEAMLRAISEDGVNFLVSVPAIYHALTNYPRFAEFDVSGVRCLAYGGAPIAESLVHRIQEHFPNARVGNGFGLTETSSLTSFLPHEESAAHADSVGFAMPVVDIAIENPDEDTGVGELLVRGPNVVRGYWNKPKETAKAFENGWLHTGDLARIEADGLLYVVDRMKDMINRGGENVYCIEVESALAGAPGVGECAALAVPDEMMGEKVGAVLVPQGDTELDVPAIIAHVNGRLADFKVPQYVVVRHEPLPRNPAGKVLKALLRDQTSWGAPVR